MNALLVILAALPSLAADDACGQSLSDARPHACIVRELEPAVSGALTVDARENGGVSVVGQDAAGVRVVAKISTTARTRERAQALAEAVTIATSGGRIAATGPKRGDDEGWTVSYELAAPRTTDLTLVSHNGGLAVTGMDATISLSTTNGGIALQDVNGHVTGTTTNGGVSVVLTGPGWRGAGLDLETTNGGVNLTVPRTYAADLEVGTTHGGVDLDGLGEHRDGERIRATLGNGGAPIRLVTTNGGVSVRARP